ncbi:hypothetical protein T265_16355, partial [Opisthorchis viverrini]
GCTIYSAHVVRRRRFGYAANDRVLYGSCAATVAPVVHYHHSGNAGTQS